MALNQTNQGQAILLLVASLAGFAGGAALCGSLVALDGRGAKKHVIFWLALSDMGLALDYLVQAILLLHETLPDGHNHPRTPACEALGAFNIFFSSLEVLFTFHVSAELRAQLVAGDQVLWARMAKRLLPVGYWLVGAVPVVIVAGVGGLGWAGSNCWVSPLGYIWAQFALYYVPVIIVIVVNISVLRRARMQARDAERELKQLDVADSSLHNVTRIAKELDARLSWFLRVFVTIQFLLFVNRLLDAIDGGGVIGRQGQEWAGSAWLSNLLAPLFGLANFVTYLQLPRVPP
jgi:hypothetical protein